MEIKETVLKSEASQSMVEDVNYFKYIFKKTEKIACAVFFILRSETQDEHTDTVIRDLEETAQEALEVSLASLRATPATVRRYVSEVRLACIALEAKLRVAHAARYVSADALAVFLHEIDSVHRAMKKYMEGDVADPLMVHGVADAPAPKPARPRVTTAAPRERGEVPTQVSSLSRRARVLEFLRDNPHATIKDIVSTITDCSEKTIQRELINLIKDNVVTREGERRWSKYRVV